MDELDEIWYLSEKGYESMDSGNYFAAKTYFKDAANLALDEKSRLPEVHRLRFDYIAKVLLKLAQDAHLMEFNPSKNKNKKLIKHHRLKIQRPEIKRRKRYRTSSKSFDINIGSSVIDQTPILWNATELMNGIATITGGSGSGKTETIKLMANELINKKIPCIIIDLHGDIEIPIDTISLDYLGNHSINPFELTSVNKEDGGPTPHIDRLMTQFSYAISDKFSSTQKSWLRMLLQYCYFSKGIKQSDPESWTNPPPTFKTLLKAIKNPEEVIRPMGNSEFNRYLDTITNSTRMALENRLVAILEHPAFSGDNNISLEEMVTKPHRILLKPLNTIDKQFLAADTIMRQIFAYLKSKGHVNAEKARDKFRLFIFIDEVKILTGYRGNLNDPYHILNRFATEARKFGLGLILASQILGHFGRDIRSNCATKLILKTMDLDEAKRCAKELKIDLKLLSSLNRPGEGFLITSDNKEARHIQMHNIDEEIIENKEPEVSRIDFM